MPAVPLVRCGSGARGGLFIEFSEASAQVRRIGNPRIWLGIALGIGAIIALLFDDQVGRSLADEHLPSDLRIVLRLSETFGQGYGAAAIVLSIAIVRRSWRTGLTLAAIVSISGMTANLVKMNVARIRPYALEELAETAWRYGFRDWLPWRHGGSEWFDHALQAFPSGHTAVAASLAVGLSRLYPHAWPWFTLLAALALWQRIAVGAHYLSDTLAGAAIGVLVGGAIADWLDRRSKQRGGKSAA